MLLSKACEYAIKACIYTASVKSNGRKVSAREISENIEAPVYFTAKILKQLGKSGVISSTKGPSGGFYLSTKQREQPLAVIITAIDGDKLFKSCALGLTECSETRPCPIHSQYGPLRDQLLNLMLSNSIRKMADSYNSGNAFLAGLPLTGNPEAKAP